MPIDITENFIRVRVRLPSEFEDDSFKTIDISKAKYIKAVIGKLKGKDSTAVQSYLFDKEHWEKDAAVAWVKDHGETPKAAAMMEIKDLPFQIKSIDEEEGIFEGYAAVFGNVDEGRDLIERGAFKKSLAEQGEFPVLWSHNIDEPIGKGWAEEDRFGLKVKAKLIRSVQRAREVWELAKEKVIKGLSIGYRTQRWADGENGIRVLKELKLFEFSPCVLPMNPKAQITGVKESAFEVTIASDDDLYLELKIEKPEIPASDKTSTPADGHLLDEIAAATKAMAAELRKIHMEEKHG